MAGCNCTFRSVTIAADCACSCHKSGRPKRPAPEPAKPVLDPATLRWAAERVRIYWRYGAESCAERIEKGLLR